VCSLEYELVDRRRHERFKINGRAFVYYETHSPKVAEIMDISTDGVAFSYVGSTERLNQPLQLEIIVPDSTGFMEKLPCRTVSDCQVCAETDESRGTRRCSVQFADLTDAQKAEIECFIENYCWRVSK
jgi:c-di-GMP-binding flagellar brake protein YcgR